MPQFSCTASTALIGNRLFNVIVHLSGPLGPCARLGEGLCPGSEGLALPKGFHSISDSEGAKGTGWGLGAVLPSLGAPGRSRCRLAAPCSPCRGRLARVLLCLPGMSSKPRPVTGNFQPER